MRAHRECSSAPVSRFRPCPQPYPKPCHKPYVRAPGVQLGAGEQRPRLGAQQVRQPREGGLLLVHRHVGHQRQVLHQAARLPLRTDPENYKYSSTYMERIEEDLVLFFYTHFLNLI